MSNRRTFIKQAVFSSGALALGIFPEELFASGELVRLSVVHTNDLHCRIDPFPATHAEFAGRGGMLRLASLVAKLRAENPNLLLLDAGDLFQGTPYFNYFKGDIMTKIMSRMGYDAATIGNHEFDNGLGDIDSALREAKFPFISSNYDFADTILANKVEKFKVLDKGGVKVGIYGLGIELNGLVSPQNFGNTRFLNPLETALQMEKMLKKELKCDLVIALSHLGLSYEHDKISDKSLAAQTRFTDLIVGGHSHSFLDKPLLLKNAQDGPILVNQAGTAALMAGKIEFVFSRSSKKQAHSSVVYKL